MVQRLVRRLLVPCFSRSQSNGATRRGFPRPEGRFVERSSDRAAFFSPRQSPPVPRRPHNRFSRRARTPASARAALMGQVIGSESRKCVGEDDALCDRHSGNKNDAQHHHAGPAAPFMSLLKGFRSEILKSNHPQRLLSASWAAASSLRALL